MRKGYSLENQLAKLVDWINNQGGGHAHKNHAARTVQGIFIEGEPYDYDILYKGGRLCFDAKECQSERWGLTNAKLTQVKYLKNCKNNGADAFFLVYFYPSKQLIKFDVDIVLDAIKHGRGHLKANEGEVFIWN